MQINNINQFYDLAEQITENFDHDRSIDFSTIELNIDPITIKIEGEKYNSTLDTKIMESIIEYQKRIYDCYSLALYNKVNKLSEDEKKDLMLFVKVENGCSFIKFDVNEILKEMIKKMNNRQVIVCALGCAIIIVGGAIIAKIHTNNTTIRLKEIEQKTAILSRESESEDFKQYSESLKTISLASMETQKNLLATLSNTNGKISIDNCPVSYEELADRVSVLENTIEEISSINEDFVAENFEEINRKGNFNITKITIPLKDGDPYIIDIKNAKEGYKKIELAKDHLTEEQQEILIFSLKKKPVYIDIVLKINKKTKKVVEAQLVEIKKLNLVEDIQGYLF